MPKRRRSSGHAKRAARRKPADEDLVDARAERRAESREVVGRREVEVAGEDNALLVPDEIGDALELILTPRVAVRHDDAVVHPDRMHDPLKPDGADDGRPAVDESHPGQDRVCLPRERGAQKTVIDRGEPAAEPCALDPRAPGDDARRVHAAPALEVAERPERKLLETHDVRRVVGDELDHLPQERTALRRVGVAVKDVPRTYEHRHPRSLRSDARRSGRSPGVHAGLRS